MALAGVCRGAAAVLRVCDTGVSAFNIAAEGSGGPAQSCPPELPLRRRAAEATEHRPLPHPRALASATERPLPWVVGASLRRRNCAFVSASTCLQKRPACALAACDLQGASARV